jgi:putative membrane protein
MEWNLENLLAGVVASLAFGLVGIVLTLLGFKLFDWITPRIKIEHELSEKHNIAVAIVVGSVIIGICLIVAQVVGSSPVAAPAGSSTDK